MRASGPVIVDTGVLFAALDRDEEHHEWVRQTLAELQPPLLTCDAVISEACFLLDRDQVGLLRLARWFDTGFVRLAHESQNLIAQTLGYMRTYCNIPMSYADACLVCMVEASPGACVFTIDSDFQIYRQRNRRVIPLIAPFA